MSRASGPFAAPPSRKPATRRHDTPDEAAEKVYVRGRDNGCVARRAAIAARQFEHDLPSCDGPLEVDHVRASGGLGMKSATHRTNLVVLCHWHHRLKTEYGKTWRPMLLRYLEQVEPADDR